MDRQFDNLRLGSIELFCLTAQHQGFTAAAKATGLTAAAVSRSVARLEERLGVRLLMRTTRRVRLTEVGQRYYDQCRQALAQLSEAEREASGQQLKPAGLVRMSLPTSYGHHRVLPLLPAFSKKYPDIEIELQLSNRNVDFTEEGFDLAIRGRTPPDSSLVARKLEDAALVVVAAPAYLKRHGKPASPDQLGQHAGNLRCLSRLLGIQFVGLDEVGRGTAHHPKAVQELFEVAIAQSSLSTQVVN